MEQCKVLELLADDAGTKDDVPAWCKRTGNGLLSVEENNGMLAFYIKKS